MEASAGHPDAAGESAAVHDPNEMDIEDEDAHEDAPPADDDTAAGGDDDASFGNHGGEDEDDDGGLCEPLRTANEVVALPEPEAAALLTIDPHAPLLRVGVVSNVLALPDATFVVAAKLNDKALYEETVLCLEDRTPIGRIWEVFGPVRHPHYIVRYARRDAESAPAWLGKDVFSPNAELAFIQPHRLASKGCDASDVYDEELGDEDLEFSDDELQQASSSRRRKRKGSGRKGGHEDHHDGAPPPPAAAAPPAAHEAAPAAPAAWPPAYHGASDSEQEEGMYY
ncbi:Gar1/Naf1 RNA binding region-domain-containing protein [Pelagophyceae sp. CCMP2097]|nr:Gar1/Naf1 RNA binding region-domain-containing protein [Pelagophyceae sp. CCMP2097]